MQHFERFLLPSITQVEYRLGVTGHFLSTSLLTPVTDFLTQMYVVLTFRLPIPHWLVVPLLTPMAMRIFRQDLRILALQTETVRRFGGRQFASTEIDVLGPSILRLLLDAQRGGNRAKDAPEERRVRIRV